jgi:hypothetical protein
MMRGGIRVKKSYEVEIEVLLKLDEIKIPTRFNEEIEASWKWKLAKRAKPQEVDQAGKRKLKFWSFFSVSPSAS